MVHRPSDSRLLTNLLSVEKDYSKHLLGLLDYSHASLSSFSAYAAASPPPASNAIIAVAGTLSGADDALRRYAAAVDAWREQLRELKELEDDVGTIMRDREILVTRLIKASKSNPKRDSHAGMSAAASGSAVSLKSDFSSSLAYNLNPSSKLSAAQSELQACEAQLAARERELEEKRLGAIREGLSARCKAMVECGWAWGEMGKEGLRALEQLTSNGHQDISIRPLSPSSQFHKPLPDPIRRSESDVSSLAPSQSASNIALPSTNPAPSGGDAYYQDDTISDSRHDIPAAHKIEDYANYVPTGNMGPAPRRRPLSRRITEESEGDEIGGSSEEEEDEIGAVNAVDNPKYGGKGFSIRGSRTPTATASDVGARSPPNEEKKGFFGSIRGLFKGNNRDKDSSKDQDSNVSSERPKTSGVFGGGEKKWATRTDKNLKAARRGKGDSSDEDEPHRGVRLAMSDVGPASPPKLRKGKSPTKRERHDTERTVTGSGWAQGLQSGKMPDQTITQWVNDSQGGDTIKPKPKTRNSIKKPKPKSAANGKVPTENGTAPAASNHLDGQFYLAPGSTPGAAVSDSHLPISNGGLSRSDSVSRGSVMSAPATSARARRASTMSNTKTNAASSSLTTTNGIPKRANSVHTSSPEKPKVKKATQGHERRSSGSGVITGLGTAGNPPSLMSIVEGVSKANRQGWQTHQASKSQPQNSTPSMGFDIPKAPPRVTRDDLESGPRVTILATANPMALPKAPGSVIPIGNGSPITSNGHSRAVVANSTMPPVISPKPIIPVATPKPIVPSASTSSGALKSSSTSSLALPKPLKSALRSPSRTPSPNPQMIPTRRMTESPLGRGDAERVGRSTTVKQSGLPAPEPKVRDSDVSSISSYETTHENPDDLDDIPPPPPPHDHPSSDISASSASTQMAAPVRRKSVRVSLQPTFSPTPPAFDDDEVHAPWGGKSEPTWGKQRNGATIDGDRDMWEDSSEEDEEYQKARKLLSRAGKKKAKK